MNNYYFCVYEMSKKKVVENVERDVKVELDKGDEIIDLDLPPEEEEALRQKEIERLNGKSQNEGSKVFGSVPDKLVKNLTGDERTLILKNYIDKVDNDNFNVRQLKNGNFSITRKRTGKVKSLDDDIIKKATGVANKSGGNMTNEQMLIQNIIDMEKRLERESMKRKILKRKYKKMKSDIYVDDEENENEIIISPNDSKDDEPEVEKVVEKVDEPVSNHVEPPKNSNYNRSIRQKLSYRDQLLLRAQQYHN